jgi:hypothetical protein
MFGKLTSALSWWKCLEVYTVKRYPGAKLPLWGMVGSYLALYYLLSRFALNHRTKSLKRLRENKQHMDPRLCPTPGYWSFNRDSSYNPFWMRNYQNKI